MSDWCDDELTTVPVGIAVDVLRYRRCRGRECVAPPVGTPSELPASRDSLDPLLLDPAHSVWQPEADREPGRRNRAWAAWPVASIAGAASAAALLAVVMVFLLVGAAGQTPVGNARLVPPSALEEASFALTATAAARRQGPVHRPRHLVFLLHATEQIRPQYEEALAERVPGAKLHIVNSPFGVRARAYRHLLAHLSVQHRTGYLDALARHVGAGELAQYDTITLASFSAGYAGVREILSEPESAELVDAVVAIDSWHAELDPDGTPRDEQLAALVDFARLAAAGERICWLRHTDVRVDPRAPYVFASTTQMARELRRLLGLPLSRADLWEEGLRISSVDLRSDDFSEHVAALTVWGDEWLADAVLAAVELRGARR